MPQRYDLADRRTPEPERWHMSKSVQISHILATVMALVAALMYVTDMRRDQMVKDAQHEARFDAIEKRQLDDRVRASGDRAEILQKFNTIDAKLDVLMQQRRPR